MIATLLTVSLRQNAVFLPMSAPAPSSVNAGASESCLLLMAQLRQLGFTVSEPLLTALSAAPDGVRAELVDTLQTILGTTHNWTPLVRGWDVPTGENRRDHIITWFVNLVGGRGPSLACGHVIPADTFPLDRYTGCPFCGTPFDVHPLALPSQGSSLKCLQFWGEEELTVFYRSLLLSRTPLDATQVESLRTLVARRPLPEAEITMKETATLVTDACLRHNKADDALRYLTCPGDILRYLWYKKTGCLQLVQPKTIARRTAGNAKHLTLPLDQRGQALAEKKAALKLKYTRAEARQAAQWLNTMPLAAADAALRMHARREMWVRFIRALRLTEFARKPGFGKLAALLDLFYRQDYEVYEGRLDRARTNGDHATLLRLLAHRPGLFARCLFATMLRVGAAETLTAFSGILDQVPARLVFTLSSLAPVYFSPSGSRIAKPLGGVAKSIPKHPLLAQHTAAALQEMICGVEDLCLAAMEKRFAALPTECKTIHIEPLLFKMPVAIGDRSGTVQDLPSALMGARFPVAGEKVRLFMQWGAGLPAQHLDMDLSCHIAIDEKTEVCSYYSLATAGAKHSGDIRAIPDLVGTAEYIELDLAALAAAGASYVVFTCNAYSVGSIIPGLVLGWMSSQHRITISETTGVAYDPSCVQHQVRITQKLAKGLVFGVLELASREIIWLEMPFTGQTVASLNVTGVEALLTKLSAKLSIGNLLMVKARAQHLTCIDTPGADENYTTEWAANAAAVTQFLVG